MPICSVCGKNQTQRVCNSRLAPMSNAYCDPCFQLDLEPWGDFIGAIFSNGITNKQQLKESFSPYFLEKMTKYNHKTLEDALSEAKSIDDAYLSYCQEQEKQNDKK